MGLVSNQSEPEVKSKRLKQIQMSLKIPRMRCIDGLIDIRWSNIIVGHDGCNFNLIQYYQSCFPSENSLKYALPGTVLSSYLINDCCITMVIRSNCISL